MLSTILTALPIRKFKECAYMCSLEIFLRIVFETKIINLIMCLLMVFWYMDLHNISYVVVLLQLNLLAGFSGSCFSLNLVGDVVEVVR